MKRDPISFDAASIAPFHFAHAYYPRLSSPNSSLIHPIRPISRRMKSEQQ